MQVRRGQTKQTNMPQLSSGEFGWSIDTQQLFIGNGAITEGAPAVGNTEVITEHNINNFFLYAEAGYKYYSTLTDVGSIFRPIQEKLDDFVTLNDFITTSTDYSVAIQKAVSHASSIGKPLTMPEGNFLVTATVFIPSNTEIRGAGRGKTTITVAGANTNTVFQTISSAGVIFDSGAMTERVSNVKISGVSFVSPNNGADSILKLDCVADSIVENCGFTGLTSLTSATSTLTTAISFREISSHPANLTNNITIKNCVFDYLSTAVYSDYDISNIVIAENKFKVLNTGIVFGRRLTGTTGRTYGPRSVRILNNTFDTINRQAIYVGTTATARTSVVSDVLSMNNTYINVGNLSKGELISNNVTEVIRFESWGNASKNDNFERLNKHNDATNSEQFKSTITDTFRATDKLKPAVLGPAELVSTTPRFYQITSTNGSDYPFFVYPLSLYNYGTNTKSNCVILINYTLVKPDSNLIRRGTLEIVINGNTRTDTVIKDTFSSNITTSDGDVEFTLIPVKPVLDDYININDAIVIYVRNNNIPTATLSYTFTVRQ